MNSRKCAIDGRRKIKENVGFSLDLLLSLSLNEDGLYQFSESWRRSASDGARWRPLQEQVNES